MELIERILKAGASNAQEIEVYLVEGSSVSAELKREKVATATGSRDWGLSIRTIARGQIGASATSSPARWEECLEAALASMRLATPQEWKGLPEPAELRKDAPSFDKRVSPEPPAAQDLLRGMLEG
ncbi:MAG TPA: DNA gyrase modulator, partial [Methanomicrobiales archaeon]|nr:DNA gyrase modulator [Methanomicrobiales archaeon]